MSRLSLSQETILQGAYRGDENIYVKRHIFYYRNRFCCSNRVTCHVAWNMTLKSRPHTRNPRSIRYFNLIHYDLVPKVECIVYGRMNAKAISSSNCNAQTRRTDPQQRLVGTPIKQCSRLEDEWEQLLHYQYYQTRCFLYATYAQTGTLNLTA